jgi:hypothetical protein
VHKAIEVVNPILKFFGFFVAFIIVTIVIRLWQSLQKAIRSMALAWYVLELKVES